MTIQANTQTKILF